MIRTTVAGLILCFCLIAGVAPAAQTETVNGIPHISNGSTPAHEMQRLELRELWRTGGDDDDDVFYGSIGNITSDAASSIFILDTQQSTVQEFSPSGEWMGSLSREGDGPGEVRSPECVYLDQDGRLCFPVAPVGSIVRVNRDNTPAESIAFSTGEGTDGGLTIPLAGSSAGDGLAIAAMRLFFGDDGKSRQHYFLSVCDATGLEQSVLLEKDMIIDYTDFRMDEASMDFAWSRWIYGQDGKIYIAPERNEYRIEVRDARGKLERVITRDYDSYERDDYLRKRATTIIEGVAAYHGPPLQGLTIEDVEADIRDLWVDRDGYLWVRTSRGLAEKPDGAYAVLDVFAPDGTFDRQVAVLCDADPYRDAMTMVNDGRVAVTMGSLDAWLTQQAVDRDEDDRAGEEPKTLEIIIYGRE
ncbi:MAG: hypothetical protein KOO60_04975 [Gemmatimonadales bacterium]|nr:hypothetical protein [Gemmatimonadales bacterium]